MMVEETERDSECSHDLVPQTPRNDERSVSVSTVNRAPSSGSKVTFVKKGILLKKGMSKLLRPWKLRTIVLLINQKLQYFDGKILKGEVSLTGTTIKHLVPEKADGKNFAFEIANISGVKMSKIPVLVLCAGSGEEANDWVEALSIAVKQANTTKATEYVSFGEMSLTSNAAPLDIKKLKELRLQKANEGKKNWYLHGNDDNDDDDDDDDDDVYGNNNMDDMDDGALLLYPEDNNHHSSMHEVEEQSQSAYVHTKENSKNYQSMSG